MLECYLQITWGLAESDRPSTCVMFDIYGLNSICRNTQGKTPLHIAVDHDKMPDGHLRIVDSLLEQSSVKLNVLNVQDAEVCYMCVLSYSW